jgi:tRNA/tmRNA/rRNA uracil-C5-methylase (TrmA/RlmC/RlmD family)
VLEASPHRREHVWAEAALGRDPAERAGGAEFGHIELAHQPELKRQVVADALARMAGVDSPVAIEPLDGETVDGTRWRTRVTLHVAENGVVGPFAARSHRVIPVESLPLAVPALEAEAPRSARFFAGGDSVELAATSTGQMHVVTVSAGGLHRRAGRGSRPATAAAPTRAITEVVRGREFALDLGGFWQVHRLAAETLYDAVQDAIDEALFDPRAANLDLYGGVGLLAAAVGDRFGLTTRITSVESSEHAPEHAGANLSGGVGAQAVTGRVEHWIRGAAAQATAVERTRQRAATVVLDPPRSGASKEVVAELIAMHPAQLVYVACDPVAFARDAALLRAGGYQATAVRGFDLFPNTHHVELVATFTPS